MKFALLGAAGYVAPRHMKAIRDLGHDLVAACDPHDSVGVLDEYAPGCEFFTDERRFWAHVEALSVDAVSICTPNHLHVRQAERAMEVAGLVVCEKPLALRPPHLYYLEEVEHRLGSRVATILQLRHHHEARRLRQASPGHARVAYATRRGPWYRKSWKGDPDKSGGLAMNIGVHLFDLLIWAFGPVKDVVVDHADQETLGGRLQAGGTDVQWLLSTAADETLRAVSADGEGYDLTRGFTDLHTESYRAILNGEGPGIEDARPSIELVERIRKAVREAAA